MLKRQAVIDVVLKRLLYNLYVIQYGLFPFIRVEVYLCTVVNFVIPERLLPTASATKFHSLRSSFQVMLWKGMTDDMEVTNGDGTVKITA